MPSGSHPIGRDLRLSPMGAGVWALAMPRGVVAYVDEADIPVLVRHRWYRNANGYAYTLVKRGRREVGVLMHRLILRAPTGVQVDHRDGNRLNNTRANLRLCNQSENSSNARKAAARSSRFKGVTCRRDRKGWRAEIMARGQRRRLGVFHTEEAAALAYDAAARELHGTFARLNFPDLAAGEQGARVLT